MSDKRDSTAGQAGEQRAREGGRGEGIMILKLMIDLPEEQSYVRATRLVGRTLLEHLKVVEQDIDEIELVVGELCANVIRHSRSTERRFRMALEYHEDRIVITVE